MAERDNLVDFHIHSYYSSDAVLSPFEIIEQAKRSGVKHIAITDHNNIGAVRELWDYVGADLKQPFIEIDGVKIFSGVEVTCRVGGVENKKGNDSTKIHMLIYGADFSSNSPLARLIDIKHKNDRDCDIGILQWFLSRYPNHKVTPLDINNYISAKREKVPGYSFMSADDVREFLKLHGITIAKTHKAFRHLLERVPRYDRLNIDAKDLIQVAHASGGICIMAHPGVNLKKAKDKNALLNALCRLGIDGFESIGKEYAGKKAATRQLINKSIKVVRPRNSIVFSAGSDTHDFSKGITLGKWRGTQPILLKENNQLIRAIDDLSEARKKGILSVRNYPKVYLSDINDIVTGYAIQKDNLKYYIGHTSSRSEDPKTYGQYVKTTVKKKNLDDPAFPTQEEQDAFNKYAESIGRQKLDDDYSM